MLKKFLAGFVVGAVLFGTITSQAASDVVKLIVNGKEVQSDVPAQIIDGRTMVPARPLAEALGAKVEWDDANGAVVITSAAPAVDCTVQPSPAAALSEVSPSPAPGTTAAQTGTETAPASQPVYIELTKLNKLLTAKFPGKDMWVGNGALLIGDASYSIPAVITNGVPMVDVSSLLAAGILSDSDINPPAPPTSTTSPVYVERVALLNLLLKKYPGEMPIVASYGVEFRRVKYNLTQKTGDNGSVLYDVSPLITAGILSLADIPE